MHDVMTHPAVLDYREALDRLREAQGRYEANRDDRASDARLVSAIHDVLVARADLESIRRHHPDVDTRF